MKVRKQTRNGPANGRKAPEKRGADAGAMSDRTGEHAQAILKSLSEAIIIADNEGRCLDANQAVPGLLGVPREELIGRDIATFAREEPEFTKAWKDFRRKGRL